MRLPPGEDMDEWLAVNSKQSEMKMDTCDSVFCVCVRLSVYTNARWFFKIPFLLTSIRSYSLL